jgi:hypothetical protein
VKKINLQHNKYNDMLGLNVSSFYYKESTDILEISNNSKYYSIKIV